MYPKELVGTDVGAQADEDDLVRDLFERTVAAQEAWVAGDASRYIDLFSAERLTICGPFGGTAVGRDEAVVRRAAALFESGTVRIELSARRSQQMTTPEPGVRALQMS